MANARDWDQMLQSALEMKSQAQKFIDFAKLNGAGNGGEGEEDLEEQEDSMEEEGDMEEAPEEDVMPPPASGKNPKAAIMIAIGKAKKGKK